MLLYSIKGNDDYQIITIRPDPLYLGHYCYWNSLSECSSSSMNDTLSFELHPHLFLNERGEYECSIIETNRIRALLNLPPLDLDDE